MVLALFSLSKWDSSATSESSSGSIFEEADNFTGRRSPHSVFRAHRLVILIERKNIIFVQTFTTQDIITSCASPEL